MMTGVTNGCRLPEDYDVIQATVDGFKRSVERFRRRPNNDSYFWDMFRHMQFMQADEVFEMMSGDIDDLIAYERFSDQVCQQPVRAFHRHIAEV